MPIIMSRSGSIHEWARNMLEVAMRNNDEDFYPFDMGTPQGQEIDTICCARILQNFSESEHTVRNIAQSVIISSKDDCECGIEIWYNGSTFMMRFYNDRINTACDL